MTARLTDHALGEPVTLWRLRHPDRPGELMCVIAQSRPGQCAFALQWNGRPVAVPSRIRNACRSRPNALVAAVRTAEQWRAWLCTRGWYDAEGER